LILINRPKKIPLHRNIIGTANHQNNPAHDYPESHGGRLSPVIPFAGAQAFDNCAEAVSIQPTSKGAKIASVTDSKNPAAEYVANAQAKVGRDLGKPQTAAGLEGIDEFQRVKGDGGHGRSS